MAVQMELAIQTATLQTIAVNRTARLVCMGAMEQIAGQSVIHRQTIAAMWMETLAPPVTMECSAT
jgi:hypothetical protein